MSTPTIPRVVHQITDPVSNTVYDLDDYLLFSWYTRPTTVTMVVELAPEET
jgi:hypothetical protein